MLTTTRTIMNKNEYCTLLSLDRLYMLSSETSGNKEM